MPPEGHKIYPHLLGNLRVNRPNQVWCADITYLPMRRGFLYLVARMDWFTRKVMAWKMDTIPHPATTPVQNPMPRHPSSRAQRNDFARLLALLLPSPSRILPNPLGCSKHLQLTRLLVMA